jgi:hypothetical protein
MSDSQADGMTPEQSDADVFYGGDASIRSNYEPAIKHDVGRIGDARAWTSEQRDEALATFSRAFHDAKLSSSEASIITGHLAATVKEPPDQETVDGWAAESRRMLRERYGSDAEAVRRLGVITEFVRNRPTLAVMLKETGVGAHPDVIKRLAERADTSSTYGLRVTPRRTK